MIMLTDMGLPYRYLSVTVSTLSTERIMLARSNYTRIYRYQIHKVRTVKLKLQ